MSQSRSEASRRNGAKSNGPKTPEGKARSSGNATRHGLTSDKLFVLENETPEHYQKLRDSLIAEYEPASEHELHLVCEIAGALWRQRRLWSLETGLMDTQMELQAQSMQSFFNKVEDNDTTRQCMAFKALADQSGSLGLLLRYESRIRRNYERAIKNLRELQAERRQGEAEKMRNEPKIAHPARRASAPPQQKMQNQPEPSSLDPALPQPDNRPNLNRTPPLAPDLVQDAA